MILEYSLAIEKAQIPMRTAQRWQELADVPHEEFEAHLAADEKPTTRSIIESPKAKPRISEEAPWLWSVRDFERMGLLDIDPLPLIEQMTPTMRADVLRLAPLVGALLNRCTEKEIARILKPQGSDRSQIAAIGRTYGRRASADDLQGGHFARAGTLRR